MDFTTDTIISGVQMSMHAGEFSCGCPIGVFYHALCARCTTSYSEVVDVKLPLVIQISNICGQKDVFVNL